ncbi:MAG: AMP-binding protein [Gammaproteobacteria bacterium]|nr:AMP-binding protein [Gammaproteobacteria bacterium]
MNNTDERVKTDSKFIDALLEKTSIEGCQNDTKMKKPVFASTTLAVSQGGALNKKTDAPVCLSEVLERAALTEKGVVYIQGDGREHFQSYKHLLEDARRILAGLRKLGLKPQAKIIFQIKPGEDFIPAFWACVLGGFIPAPISIAAAYDKINSNIKKLYNAWQMLEQPLVLTSARLAESVRSLSTLFNIKGFQVETVDSLTANEPDQHIHKSLPNDLALLLLTSGSTGLPKAVMLTHHNLLSMSAGTVQMNGFSSQDVTLNWMPLDHAGAIAFLGIMAVDLACRQIQAPTELILQNPLKWLELIQGHQASVSWAPNFAFSLINERAEEINRQTWDLSSMRFLVNAGEQIVAKTARSFLRLLEKHGLPSNALRPAFGMSETCSGITWSAGFSLENSSDDMSFVELGCPVPGTFLRIADENNRIVTEGTIGRLQVSGSSVTSGYYLNPERNREAFSEDGWFITGDTGYLQNGCLVLTGRDKDDIIINGINYYSHEIESATEEVEGVEVSYTAACAVRRPGDNSDRLALFFVSSKAGLKDNPATNLIKKIRGHVVTNIGLNPEYIIPVNKETIPKTAIGKIQRSQLSKRFEAGEFETVVREFDKEKRIDNKRKRAMSSAEIEQRIVKIWQDVLNLPEVGLYDNFFESGGHSLLLVQVQAQLQEQFGTLLSVVDLFKYPTIKSLADCFNQSQNEKSAAQRGYERAQVRNQASAGHSDIAVIGMAGRFPGADNLDEFWQNLKNGVESISFFTEEEVIASGVAPGLARNPDYVKARPILSDVESFDANFFGYSGRDAEWMDPQHRLLLECAWESLEDAGYNPLIYRGLIGVYAGTAMSTYLLNNFHPNRHNLDVNDELAVVTLDSLSGLEMMVANDKDTLATRISYKLNLRGPSVNVQSACSTSLLAIHLAVQSLSAGECDMALAGGVTVQVPQKIGYLFHEGMLVSPDGHCRSFDANAKGTVFGNGAGIAVLKRLKEAVADGDHIYAVIKGTASNNDGGMKVGYMAPSGDGQAVVVSEAIARAGITADTVTYVEMHGTGTVMGDSIEVGGLAQGFQVTADKKEFCAIGSVKSNVGHLTIASGIAGFIKTVLALHHKQIPPSLHFEQPNPNIDFADSPFYVNTRLRDWETGGPPRRAGVNSLAIGGTNVHLVLEEASPSQAPEKAPAASPQAAVLSARNNDRLRAYAKRIVGFLEKQPDIQLRDLAYTLQTGRQAMAERLAVVALSLDELREKLTQYIQGQTNDIPHFYLGNVKNHEEGAESVETMIQDRKLSKLAQLWIRGTEIDWQSLYPGHKPQRISLPAYPFAKERYWIEPVKNSAGHDNPVHALVQPADTRKKMLAVSAPFPADSKELQEKLQQDLLKIIATILKVNEEGIDLAEDIRSYGADSITITLFANQLNKIYNFDITSALLFECSSIASLTRFLCSEHQDRLCEYYLVQKEINPDAFSVYPLSIGQKELLQLSQFALEQQSPVYHITFSMRIISRPDVMRLKNAFQTLIARHPSLRTVFTTAPGGEPVQKIHESQTVCFEHVDASNWNEDVLKKRAVEACQRPFDLEQGPLLRADLFTRSDTDHVLLLTIHHMVTDGWSLWILLDELMLLYMDDKHVLPPIKRSYTDYVEWQTQMLESAKGERLWNYWKQQLAGEQPVLNLPIDRPRRPVQSLKGASVDFCLDQALTQKLKELAYTEKATLYMVLLAVFKILLYRYAKQKDISTGSQAAGRSRAEFEDIVGYFVNSVVLRTTLSDELTFKTFLQRVCDTVKNALAHQDYPCQLLEDRLQPHVEPGRTSFYDAEFIFQKPHRATEIIEKLMNTNETVSWGGLELKSFTMGQQSGEVELTLEMMEGDGSLYGHLKYYTDLYEENTIVLMAQHFQNLLKQVASNPNLCICELASSQ